MSQSVSVPVPSATSVTGGFQSYLNYACSQPVLTAEEERSLFRAFQEDNDLEAARTLVLSHLRFVVFIAKSYSGYGLPLEDLVQQGSVGLMKSVRRFDLSFGVRLASFAVHWIKAEIHEYVLNNWKLVKIATTKAQRKLFFNLRQMKKRLGWMSEREAKEVADCLDVGVADVYEMENRLYQQDNYFDESFGEVRSENNEPNQATALMLEDHSSNPENLLVRDDLQQRAMQEVQKLLERLDDRARDIVENRWLRDGDNGLNLKYFAEKYGISQERVRQIEANSLTKMRRYLVDKGIVPTDVSY